MYKLIIKINKIKLEFLGRWVVRVKFWDRNSRTVRVMNQMISQKINKNKQLILGRNFPGEHNEIFERITGAILIRQTQ